MGWCVCTRVYVQEGRTTGIQQHTHHHTYPHTHTHIQASPSASSSSTGVPVLLAVSRVTPETVRKLGVALDPQGQVQVSDVCVYVWMCMYGCVYTLHTTFHQHHTHTNTTNDN